MNPYSNNAIPVESASPAAAPATAGAKGYAWVVFSLMFCLLLSDYMSRQALNALFPLLKAQWQITDTQLGSISSVVPLMVGVLTLPFSIIADRWGRVRSIALMVAVWSAATAGCAIASSYHEMFIARFFVGVGEAAYGSVGFAMLLSIFPRHMRSTVAGGFTSAAAFGSVLGVSLSGLIATHFGWRWSMGVMAIIGFVLVIIYCAVVTEEKLASVQPSNANATPKDGRVKLTPRAFVSGLFPSRSVFCAYLGSALQLFVQGTLFVWLPSYLHRYWDMPVEKAAVLAAGLLLVSGLGQLLCGVMTDRVSGDSVLKRWNMAIFYCLALGTLLAVAFRLPHGNLQLAFLAPGVFFLASTFGTCNPIIAEGTPPAIHGSVFATLTLFNNILGLAAGPLITGMVADAVGLEVALRWLPLAAVPPFAVFVIGRWCHVAEKATRDIAGK
ncbi:Hexuronate transporter [Cupriavidus yeoncheonensis]|uniref:Hexuronate transporter n=1 Tax=Cupriavidus yeoncheonensis TaxID=1462994 RepID=A0A916J3V1_9BURK|nr:MFS transporter [Cupriavidus yeoncheonensis]CAG2158281.1 Hexuronate transporter [Cupriavidus yeoncheonensis]